MMIRRWFLEHPRSVGETYGQHCAAALSFSLPLLGAGLACAVHAFLPFLFKTTASRAVVRLNERIVLLRRPLSCRHQEAIRSPAEARDVSTG
jgi:hypothetical protein